MIRQLKLKIQTIAKNQIAISTHEFFVACQKNRRKHWISGTTRISKIWRVISFGINHEASKTRILDEVNFKNLESKLFFHRVFIHNFFIQKVSSKNYFGKKIENHSRRV